MSDTETRFGLEVVEIPGNRFFGRILKIEGNRTSNLHTTKEYDEDEVVRLVCRKKAAEKFWTPLQDMSEVSE